MSRAELARRQHEFVEALRDEAASFEGVPAARMRALRESLMRRRLKHLRRLAPALDAWLGPRFEPLFRARLGGDRGLGPLADLLSFAAGLSDVPDAVAAELLVHRRRGWAWLSTRRRVLIVLGSLRIEVPFPTRWIKARRASPLLTASAPHVPR